MKIETSFLLLKPVEIEIKNQFQKINLIFRASTGVLRQCFGAPDRFEQRYHGLGKYEPYIAAD